MTDIQMSSNPDERLPCCDGGLCRQDWHRHPIHLVGFFLVVLVVQILDVILTMNVEVLEDGTGATEHTLKIIGDITDIAFIVVLVTVVLQFVRHRLTASRESDSRVTLVVLAIYLAVASINVIVNMVTLVIVQKIAGVSQNALIIDLGLLFASNMLIFSLWYQLADAYFKDGAFDFPPNAAHPDDPPRWIDYLFLSFNTQTTFGPTVEAIRTRPVKVMMMLQTLLSLVVLVVLVARIISAPG